MATDSKAIRRFQAGVDRALGLFDATNEWADYIAFLTRLLKALQAAPTAAEIPSKTTLARHLAQCLTPTLPAGVHQKTLEVYDCIFGILGSDGVSRDLSLFLPGFANTLTFASLTTRPWFLTLYDEHLLKLSPSVLRPALKAIILSLLPGIEEENSEDFERTLSTLTRIRTAFADNDNEAIFWQSLFLASITSVSRRSGVLVYLNRYLPKLESLSANAKSEATDDHVSAEARVITTPEPGLLFRCFATGLQDEQPLVQRGFLDLLVTHLPLASSTLQKAESRRDLDILMSAAMSIVLKRDMSLNRRLWTWFFGNDESEQAPKTPVDDRRPSAASNSAYFESFGCQPVIGTLEAMLARKSSAPNQRARPFRLLVSLMDRSAIGNPVVDALFIRLISDLRQYQSSAPSQNAFDEVFRSANVFFDSIEPRKLTRNLLHLLSQGELELLEFILVNFSLDDGDLDREHVPAVVMYASAMLVDAQSATSNGEAVRMISAPQQKLAVVLDLLLDLVAVDPNPASSSKSSSKRVSRPELMKIVLQQYEMTAGHSALVTTDMLCTSSFESVSAAILQHISESSDHLLLDHLSSAFVKLLHVLPSTFINRDDSLLQKVKEWSHRRSPTNTASFAKTRNVATLLEGFHSFQSTQIFLKEEDAAEIVPSLVRQLWLFLRPVTPQYHVESVDLIWSLRSIFPELLLVDSTIMDLITVGSNSHGGHASEGFGIFWTHTRNSPSLARAATNGEVASMVMPMTLLKKAVLFVIDASAKDEVWSTWLASLPSLQFQFDTIMEVKDEQHHGDPTDLVGLNRLQRLVQVARTSSNLWKEFADTKGAAEPIVSLAMSHINQQEQEQQSCQIALDLLRAVYSNEGVTVSVEIIETLTTLLPAARAGSSLQSRVLDTLHALLSGRPDGDPPNSLLPVLIQGISSPSTEANLDKWITLLCNSIPTFSDATFFANLLKLTACFCKRTQGLFEVLESIYDGHEEPENDQTKKAQTPERSITNLLSGLEYILARAHTKVVDVQRPASANQEATAGDTARSRSVANNRLTVVLCMQDAIKVCCAMWFWRPSRSASVAGDTKSFAYISSRLRSRTRRMLEHLLDAEPQECLETIMGIWIQRTKDNSHPALVMNLLQTLDGARPKFMLPSIFNAIYSRTNPGVLDILQRSTLSVDASAVELVAFLVEYITRLEDDLLEEIWNDCVSFLRDILANPMPHRQLLLRLLQFLAALCEKMDNTSFGERTRMRRELAEISVRAFTAIFTIKPGGMDQGTSLKELTPTTVDKAVARLEAGKGIDILLQVLPLMAPILSEGDRISTVYSGVSSNITGPALRSRSFPQTLDNNILALVQIMSKSQAHGKVWRKDVTEAFNDPRIFSSSLVVAEEGWLPVIAQLAVIDKALFSDMMARLTAPTTAGIMFGVGASAARTEADKLARSNLRRVALLLLAGEEDHFAGSLSQLMIRIDELLTATPATSPSSITRGDLFLLLRAISLSLAQENLAAIWPTIDAEMRGLFDDLNKGKEANLTAYSHLQGAKLLDLLLLLQPEEFQLHEWLFITDTIDAIYPPSDTKSVAAADLVNLNGASQIDLHSSSPTGLRKPWLAIDSSRSQSAMAGLLGSFFSQLSIRAFEATYSMEPPDFEACRRDLLADLFTDPD